MMFGWDFEADARSRIWRCLIKICVWTCDMTQTKDFGKLNSTLGSIVPLAMFYYGFAFILIWFLLFRYIVIHFCWYFLEKEVVVRFQSIQILLGFQSIQILLRFQSIQILLPFQSIQILLLF